MLTLGSLPSCQKPAQSEDVESERAAPQICVDICSRVAPLHCSNERWCMAGCRDRHKAIYCPAVGPAKLCLAKQPIEHWECGADGNAKVKEGYCDAEKRKLARCDNIRQ